MARIRRTPYVIKRWFVNRGVNVDDSVPYTYEVTVWSDGAVEMHGAVLENRKIPFPFPMNSETVPADFSLTATQVAWQGGAHAVWYNWDKNEIGYSFKVHLAGDETGDGLVCFILHGNVSANTVSHIKAGHTFDMDNRAWFDGQSATLEWENQTAESVTFEPGYYRLEMTGGGGGNYVTADDGWGHGTAWAAGSGAAFRGTIHLESSITTNVIAGSAGLKEKDTGTDGTASSIFGIVCGGGKGATYENGTRAVGAGGTIDLSGLVAGVTIYGTPSVSGDGNPGTSHYDWGATPGGTSRLYTEYATETVPKPGQGAGCANMSNIQSGHVDTDPTRYVPGNGLIRITYLGTIAPE